MIKDRNLVTGETAAALQELIRRTPWPIPDRHARGGAIGRWPIVVKCTSTTAASGSGIGAQSYPAVAISADATETVQSERGEVWLTVLGDNAEVIPPVSDKLYYGMLAGVFDPASDPRPRVFAVESSGDGSGSCATTCGSLGRLADDACLTLTLVCASGSFADIDTSQFDGVIAFGAGGVWTFEKWDGDSWEPVVIDYEGGTGGAVFTWNATPLPTFTLDGIELTLMCLGEDATFAAHPRNGVTGDPGWEAEASCESNELVLRVTCTCCPLDGFTGDGWYGVDAAAGDCSPCAAVYLSLDDGSACDDTIKICTERFDTEAEAISACSDATFPACDALPASLDYTVTSDGCLNGLVSVMNEYTGGGCGLTERCFDDGNLITPCSTDSGLAYICDTLTETRSAVYNGVTLTFVSETATTITYSYPGPFGSPITGTFATFVIST